MKLPIRILIGNIPEPTDSNNWGDIINNWEAYAVEWNNTSGLGVDSGQAPVLDMFGDESISIKSVVKDLSDPKKLFTSKSRSFTVPASKKNNRIFQHYYNVEITNGLDSRELIPAKIIMNNVTHEVGNISVESVRMNKGVATHYKIKFIGKLSELARKIGQDKLSTIDFSGKDINGFTPFTLFAQAGVQDLIFPLASRDERFLLNSATSSLGIDNSRNIRYVNSTPANDYGVTAQNLVGALSVGYILDKIESTYGFNFEGVFTEGYIRQLYLWLHKPDKARDGQGIVEQCQDLLYTSTFTDNTSVARVYDFDSPSYSSPGQSPEDNKFTTTSNSIKTNFNYWGNDDFYIRIKGNWTGNATLRLMQDGVEVRSIDSSGVYTDARNVSRDGGEVYTIEAESISNVSMTVTVEFKRREFTDAFTSGSTTSYWYMNGSIVIGSVGVYKISDNLPDMKVMTFLADLFKMFNVVAEVDGDFNISTKHYDHFMSEGTQKDLSQYVEVDDYTISRPNLYSSMRMEWSDPKVAMEIGYQKVNGRKYGEVAYQLASNTGAKLSGNEYNVKVENQRVPLEPLTDLSNNTLTNVVYTQFSDLKGAEQQTKPMFTYAAGMQAGVSLGFNDGTTVTPFNYYVQPSNIYANHSKPDLSTSQVGLYFGSEQNEYNPNETATGLGLFSSFYRGTVAMMFDDDKRNVKYNAHLPLNQVKDLKLSDTIVINNNFHCINSVETNYLTGVSKLDLTIVGRSKLDFFNGAQRKITNTHSTNSLTMRYINSGSGNIGTFTIGAGGFFTTGTVGPILGASHSNYTEELA